jgi:serine protease Do
VRAREQKVGWLVAAVFAIASASGCEDPSTDAAPTTTGLPPGAVPVEDGLPAKPPQIVPPPPAGDNALPSLAPLVQKAQPSVVTVKAWVNQTNAFGREVAQSQGVGTGFVYDDKGYLLTNNHVIENATEIVVKFAGGRELDAKVVGADKPTDVAVLKVEADDLPALPLGDSRALQVGDWVVAIGNPFGLEHTVSAGILSAKGRTRDDVQGLDPTGYFNFLQTDASINPGNSGGPLLNLAGQVVGINAAVRANANGIGFAIPMDMVVQILPMLLRDGKIHRSAMGILVDELTPEDATRLKRPRKGAKITRVLPGKAGDKAGLAVGDIILAFDEKDIDDRDHLRWLASISGVSRTITVKVARGERIFDLRVTLGELDTP